MNDNQNYRPNVAAIIVSAKYPHKSEVFIAERSDVAGAWQFPQGGIDEGETAKEALFRELKEEIGTDDVKIIAEYPEWVTYDFPETVLDKMKPFTGQSQRYFLVRLGNKARIKLDTEVPEFVQHEFVGLDKLFSRVAPFKRTIYKDVVRYFQKQGYL